MDRQILSPLVVIVVTYLIVDLFTPVELKPTLQAFFITIGLPSFATELGQQLRQMNLLNLAEYVLRLSTFMNRAWTLLPGKYPTDMYIASSNQLSFVLCDRQKYKLALELNSDNIELLKKKYGEISSPVGGELVCKAYILGSMGSAELARVAAEEAMRVLEKAGNIKLACLALNNLGVAYVNFGQIEEALEIFKRALQLKEQLGLPQEQIAVAYGNVGYTLLCAKHYAEAEVLLRKAVGFSNVASHEFKATAQNNLGESLRGQGKLAEAEELLLSSMRLREKTLTNTHPHLGYSYHNVARLMADKNDDKAADEYFKKAIEIRTKAPGAKQRDFNDTATEYCKFLKRIGRDHEADAMIEAHKLEPLQIEKK